MAAPGIQNIVPFCLPQPFTIVVVYLNTARQGVWRGLRVFVAQPYGIFKSFVHAVAVATVGAELVFGVVVIVAFGRIVFHSLRSETARHPHITGPIAQHDALPEPLHAVKSGVRSRRSRPIHIGTVA